MENTCKSHADFKNEKSLDVSKHALRHLQLQKAVMRIVFVCDTKGSGFYHTDVGAGQALTPQPSDILVAAVDSDAEGLEPMARTSRVVGSQALESDHPGSARLRLQAPSMAAGDWRRASLAVVRLLPLSV